MDASGSHNLSASFTPTIFLCSDLLVLNFATTLAEQLCMAFQGCLPFADLSAYGMKRNFLCDDFLVLSFEPTSSTCTGVHTKFYSHILTVSLLLQANKIYDFLMLCFVD